MSNTSSTVLLVDDDPSVLASTQRLLNAQGFAVRVWLSPEAFLSEHDPALPGCLVTDYAMPEMDGLELQRRLRESGCERFIIFLSGHGDIPVTVRAMKAGAVSFLAKPASPEGLLVEIEEAIAKDTAARRMRTERANIEARLHALTPREREVLTLVVAGKLNKQIAGILGAAEKTIKKHRGRVMHKMGVRSVAELVAITAGANAD
jgi:FixJ family two-component response regulator